MTHDFSATIDHVMRDPKYAGLRPVIEKEILHYDILFALDRGGLLRDLTFQGGTCLRLCYGASRFSEDLDFVGGADFTPSKLSPIRECVMDHIGAKYGLDIAIKEPNLMREEPSYFGIAIDRWQIAITTSPERRDIPRQRIKFEVANVPAHDRVVSSPLRNYDMLPDGVEDILIYTESLDEIMADKVVSLANCTAYPRHRDIWDLRWLKQKGAKVDPELVLKKAEDYLSEDFLDNLESRIGNIEQLVMAREFSDEMVRFIDPDSRKRTFDREGFLPFLANDVGSILRDTRAKILADEPSFEM